MIDEKKKPNRNGGITKKQGRKRTKEATLTPKQQKFIDVFNRTGNESIAKLEAGYSSKTKLADIRKCTNVNPVIRDIKQELRDRAGKYLDKLESIMDDDSTSAKVKSDIAMNLLDRAGYKAVDKQESSVNVTGNVGNTITIELAQRARALLRSKEINVTPIA